MRISDWSSDVCSSDLDHPVVRRNLGPAGEAGAKIEIRRDGDVRRHRLDVEGPEQPRIDADIGKIVLPFDDLTKRLRACLQRIVREAAEYPHATCPRPILDELPKPTWRPRRTGNGTQPRGLAAPCPNRKRVVMGTIVADRVDI